MHKHVWTLATLGLSLALAACGGNSGGGSGTGSRNAATYAEAEGAWSGTNSLGNAFDLLLLENGDLYQVFGTANAGAFTVLGFDQGHYSVSGGTLSAPITQYNRDGSTVTGTVTATVVTGTSVVGFANSQVSAARVDFSAAPLSASHSSYNYNTPAVLADLAGAWSANLLGQAAAVSLGISATGVITGSTQSCSLSGSIAPRSSGKNVFDVRLVFGPAPCTAANQAFSGVAISYIASNGKRQFTAAMLDAGKAAAAVLYAQR